MTLSPVLRATATYPFVRLNEAAAERRARGLEVIDLGMGDPREPTDAAILQALRDGVRERMGYPAAVGLPELREAVAGWVHRRHGVALDPDTQVIPTLGSKEAIFSFAQVVLDTAGGRDTVVVTEPGYPVPGRGAAFTGARVIELPLREENGFLPEVERLCRRISILSHGRQVAEGSPDELKRGLTRPVRVRLGAVHDELVRAVGELPGVADAGRRDHSIVFRTDDPVGTNPLVVARLVGLGGRVIAVEEEPVTLEDVYLALMRRKERVAE